MDAGQPIPVPDNLMKTEQKEAPKSEEKVQDLPKISAHVISIPDVTEKIEMGASEPKVSQIAAMKLDGVLDVPSALHSFFSGVIMLQSEHTHDVHFTLDYKDRFDTSSERDYRLSVMAKELEMIKKWTTYLGTIPNEEEPMFKRARVTSPNAIGFDMHKAVASLMHENNNRTVRSFLTGLEDITVNAQDPRKKRYRKLAAAVCTDEEYLLLTRSDEITRRRFDKVAVLHSFLRHLRDMSNRIEELGIIDDLLVKFYRPAPQRALTSTIKSNFRMGAIWTDLWRHIVSISIPLKLESSQATFRELINVLSANNNQHRIVNDYPAQLSTTDGRNFMQALYTAFLCNRFTRLSVNIVLSEVSLATLMMCLLLKLIVPKQLMSEAAVIDIDNYLARWFIPAIPGFKPGVIPIDIIKAENRTKNYLESQYKAAVLNNSQGIDTNAIWNFLRTTPSGKGWATAGLQVREPIPNEAVGLLNRDDIWYDRPFGIVMQSRRDIIPQFQNFMLMVDAIQSSKAQGEKLRINSPHDRLGSALIKLLAYTASKRDQFSEFAWFTDRVLRFYTYNSLYIPDDGIEPILGEYEPMVLPLNGPFSAIAYGDFNAREELVAPINLIHAGWRVNEDYNNFVSTWLHVNEFMTDDIFGRKDRLVKALDLSSDSTGLISVLRGRLIAENDQVALELPLVYPDRDWTDRRAMVRRFRVENKIGFRLADQLIYRFDPPAIRKPGFSRLIDYSGDTFDVLSYKQLQDLIANEKYAAKLQASRRVGERIVYDMPVTYEIEYIKEWKELPSPIILPSESTYLKITPVKFQWTYDDIILDDTRKEIAERSFTPYGVDVDPFIAHDVAFLLKLMRHIEVDKTDLQFVFKFKFVVNQ